ncbi:hypothetical protein KEM48_011484 [Puccinia striiformis f. sp. tritici PST-130]|nr:hypothetical protein KEM48_011484 [Puccinia striiformis f. sp. tritici PST-130]
MKQRVKSQQVIKDSPPSSELSDVSLATIKVAEKAKIKKAKEGNHVTANEWTPIATTSASKKKKKAAEKKKTVETFLANSDDGMSKLASPILPDKGLFSALRESLPSLDPAQMNGREPNTGVTPMEVNSRATSLALKSGMSTPVPLPVDRLTVPPTDLLLTESREATTGPETTHPSNQAPAVDNKQLEMYINMFHSQWFMYDEAKKVDDRVVMKAALNQAISSQELICRILSAEEMMEPLPQLPPSNGTVLAAGRRCDDLPGSYPNASNGSTSLIDLVSPPEHSQLSLCTSPKPSAEPRSTSRSIRDERVELREPERAANRSFEASTKLCSKLRAERDERSSSEPRAKHDERPSAELRAELYDTVSAKPQPVFVRAPQTPSTPAGLTRYFTPSGPHLQQTSEPSCSKGQVSLQPQRTSSTPASSSSAAARYPLPCSTPARWKLGGIQEEKEESPTGRQHGPSLGGGQRLLESRKDLRENAKSPGKSECSKQESPKSTSSPVDPYMNLSFNPALEQLSDASQKNSCYLILTID